MRKKKEFEVFNNKSSDLSQRKKERKRKEHMEEIKRKHHLR